MVRVWVALLWRCVGLDTPVMNDVHDFRLDCVLIFALRLAMILILRMLCGAGVTCDLPVTLYSVSRSSYLLD